MLEPRETRGITDYRPFSTMKNIFHFNGQRNTVTLILLTSLMLTIGHTSDASLISDQSYLVNPTPTLPALGADDVTTVLLVNNSAHHGRFLTVRPEIGLLTSTVRTFIQDGITTEFATKVVGTKLNNGRLYAQYLKKSSRVFYDNEHLLAPSVVTSWVGEGGETLSLQNHNELFNTDDVVDWQDIDDNLGVHRAEFVGNTDFVGIQTTTDLAPVQSISSVRVEVNKQISKNHITQAPAHTKLKDGITKLTDQLETFTVNKNVGHFQGTTPTIQDTVSTIQQQRIGKNVETPGSKRVMASVTYYGFADFTTIVGDSVIVFSPSTMQSSLNLGHVTSIKGKPTLNPVTDFYFKGSPRATSTQDITISTNVKNISLKEDKDKVGANSVEGVASTFSLPSTFSLEDGVTGTFLPQEGVVNTLLLQEIVAVMPTETLSTQSESKFIHSDNNPQTIITNQKNGGATTVFLDDDPFTNFLEFKTDRISNSSAEITKKEEMLETFTTTVVDNKSVTDSSIIKSSQYDINESSCDQNYLTSQVFLTQMPKSSSAQVGDDANPLLAFDIVETTKYYCIQAVEEGVNEVGSDTVIATIDSSTESLSEELMPTELFDDLDETTAKNFEDYDVTTVAEEDVDYDGNSEEIDLIYKTLYTTYTYLTTFFEGSQSTVTSHTEIITNIISSTLEVEKAKLMSIKNTPEKQDINVLSMATKYTIPLDIVNVLSSETEIAKQSITNINHDDIVYTKTLLTTYTYYTSIFTNNDTEIMSRTEVITNFLTDNNTLSTIEPNSTHENNSLKLVDYQLKDHIELSSFIKKTALDDQVSSESNDHDEFMPSATLLLQTSFTTFTFYTTMYVGDDTNIISRLETVTNVATETLQPTKLLSVDDSSFPITYFTTFTYWTKLAKDGEITTLSREETLFNVIQPNSNGTEILTQNEATIKKNEGDINLIPSASSYTDITTYYTTYTYYTTSYDANSTIIDSNLETVTNVITSSLSIPAEIEHVTSSEEHIISTTRNPNFVLYDYKQIIDADEVSTLYFTTEVVSSINIEGSDIEVTSSTSRLQVDEAKKSILNTTDDGQSGSSSSKMYKTGLVRLIEGKRIQNNTTTLYQSKVIGTIIDNRYAQIIESTSSFLYEKAKSDEVVVPTIVEDSQHTKTQKVESTKSFIGNEEDIADTEDQEANSGSVPQRPFAPVIRPFASRNRPTYAPKQKTLSPSSATIITRSDITPTITATPALKSSSGGRYISSRRGIISSAPINPSESNLSQSSRRLFGRPSKSLSSFIDQSINQASFQPSRNRFASSSRSNPITPSSRRPNISFRPSIAPGFRASGINNNPKLRVKPTSLESTVPIHTQAKAFSSIDQISNEDEGNTTEEISGDEEEEKQTRRNPNPLLRFRRPINRPSGFSPVTRPNSGVSLRKNPLLSVRSKSSSTTSTTTSTTTPKPKSRNFQRPAGLQIRSRPQSSLFPPRGLFQSQKEIEPLEPKANEGLTAIDSEYDDSSEDDADSNQQKVQNQKRSTKLRFRRQVDTRNRFRFRRQNVTAISPNQKVEEGVDEITLNPRGKSSSRFGSRYYTPDTTTSIINHKSIRPTRPTSKRPQFTLREKDVPTSKGTTTGRTNFRRPPASGNTSLRRTATNTGTSNKRRLKSYGNFGNNKNTVENGRSSINTSRSRNTNSNIALSRGRGGSRGRNRNDYSPDLPAIDQENQPITVTHILPAELMIPVINGHVTEYKNIVTAKTSTEIVGQNQLTQFAGSNGLTSLYLNREDTSVNNAGITEHTKYLLHETITSTIIFTPTTIRGRKTSFSHILPSTAYSVEYLVTTVQPQISANAPLANILLSQLLLGNLNLPGHPIIQQPSVVPAIVPTSVEPVTEYRTHTSTYVTTIFDGKSTILPVTFQGKKILTTVYDTTAETITATEYSVDTIVNAAPNVQSQMQQQSVQQVNNLLLQQLLLQQQQQQEAQAISKTLSPQIFLNNNLQDLDDATRSILNEDFSDASIKTEAEQPTKSPRKKSRKTGGGQNRRHKLNHNMELLQQQEQDQQSVVTLYISGRRPGEFSTVLSTVNGYDHSASLHKRQAYLSIHVTNTNQFQPENTQLSRGPKAIIPNEEGSTELNRRTTALESIVGDVDRWLAQSTRQLMLPEKKSTINPGLINNTITTFSLT